MTIEIFCNSSWYWTGVRVANLSSIQTFFLRKEQISGLSPYHLSDQCSLSIHSHPSCGRKNALSKPSFSANNNIWFIQSIKQKNCIFPLRDWKFTQTIFKAGGGDGVVFGDSHFMGVDDEAGWKPLSGECKALKPFTDLCKWIEIRHWTQWVVYGITFSAMQWTIWVW